MEVRHLRYFVAVAEELHFARAAERLKIAPPTLSHGIAALEAELGTRLFSRKTKTAVSLTNSGRRFLESAQIALRHFGDAEIAGKQAARGEIGTIAISYMHAAACAGVIADSISAFSKKQPGVFFDLSCRDTFSQMAGIADGLIDVGFVRRPQRYLTGLTGFVISRHPFCAAIPKDHPLAASERVSQAALAKEKLLALTIEMEAGIWSNIAAALPTARGSRVAQRAADSFTLLTLVGAGAGITIVPDPLRRLDIPGVVYRKISGPQQICEIAVTHRVGESSAAIKAYINLLRQMRP